MVAPTWCHGALVREHCLGRMRTGFDVWIYTFNVVIHLSKVQQSALLFFTFLRCPAGPVVLVIPGNLHLFMHGTIRNCQNPRFSSLLSSLSCHIQHDECPRQVHAFQVWFPFLLMVLWWSQRCCAPNSFELVSPLNDYVSWSTTVPVCE